MGIFSHSLFFLALVKKIDSIMKLINCLILVFTLLTNLGAQNAPVSFIDNITSNEQVISVPVKANQINDIASCNLQILYDTNIASAVEVLKGDMITGWLDYNLNNPGVITVGWFTYPGLNLPDSTIIFELIFASVSSGQSFIIWDNNYPNRNWGDSNGIVLNDLPVEDYYFNGKVEFIFDNAPITSVGNFTACPGETTEVPVKVFDFDSIGAFTLNLRYDASALTFVSYNNNSGFPGLAVDNSIPGEMIISGSTTNAGGISLPQEAELITITFDASGVSTPLSWWTGEGISCKYKGPWPNYPLLNDIPESTFYIGGLFTAKIPPVILLQPLSPDTINAGAGIAEFKVEANGTGLNYQWQELITSWEDITDGGVYSGTTTDELTILNPPVTMDGFRYRCAITGDCDPPVVTDGNATLYVTMLTTIDEMHTSFTSSSGIILKAYPNPFYDQFSLVCHSPVNGHAGLKIVGSLGQAVKILSLGEIVKGKNHFKIALNDLDHGAYYVVMSIASDQHNKIIRGLKIIHHKNTSY